MKWTIDCPSELQKAGAVEKTRDTQVQIIVQCLESCDGVNRDDNVI